MINGALLGLYIGAFPTVAMILASTLFANLQVGPSTEACFQNFAAGLIIAAVAGELFPLMLDESPNNSMIGITCGFAAGLGLIYSVEYLVGYFEDLENEHSISGGTDRKSSNPPSPIMKTFPKPIEGDDNESIEGGNSESSSQKLGAWHPTHIERAHLAIAAPSHKQHIEQHILELSDSIELMENKSKDLMSKDLAVSETEEIAEAIDEEIHKLQYKLDHCRRLVQGSEIALSRANTLNNPTSTANPVHSNQSLNDIAHALGSPLISPIATGTKSEWMTDERVVQVRRRLSGLRNSADHLIEHIRHDTIDKEALQEIHEHMDVMGRQITYFHASVECVGAKWQRDRVLPATKMGDTLPMGLVVPVVVDCFVDGFLIGVSVALSSEAGIILAGANCLEMSFLGMAYATRIVKCTGSTFITRQLALYLPPLLMWASAGLGAKLGDLSHEIPAVFVGFVAFGVVALLFLVCTELLIEARNAQGEEERWWISIMIFAGIYLVLMLNHVLD